MLTISALPIFSDNYIWVLHDSRQAIAVDPGESETLDAWLAETSLDLAGIVLTHRHADHIGGVPALCRDRPGLPVHGPREIDLVTTPVGEGDMINLLGQNWEVLAVPGHTREHLAYYCATTGMLFSGDTLFGAGCGRMFDGPAASYHASLQKLANLPAATQVYCTHEYTAANLRFAAAVEPDNLAITARSRTVATLRANEQPSIPFTLEEELATNPFLRLDRAAVILAARQHGAVDTQAENVFLALRQWKNDFS